MCTAPPSRLGGAPAASLPLPARGARAGTDFLRLLFCLFQAPKESLRVTSRPDLQEDPQHREDKTVLPVEKPGVKAQRHWAAGSGSLSELGRGTSRGPVLKGNIPLAGPLCLLAGLSREDGAVQTKPDQGGGAEPAPSLPPALPHPVPLMIKPNVSSSFTQFLFFYHFLFQKTNKPSLGPREHVYQRHSRRK